MTSRNFFLILLAAIIPFIGACENHKQNATPASGVGNESVFTGTTEEVQHFMDLERNIDLTPDEEQIRVAALSQIPAPCCKEFGADTCCCPCNLAKAIWGLSKSMIRNGASTNEVRDSVLAWLKVLNPAGYAGDACDKGRCDKPVKGDACGGMNENHLIS